MIYELKERDTFSQTQPFDSKWQFRFKYPVNYMYLVKIRVLCFHVKDGSFLRINWDKHLYVSFFMYLEDGPIIKDIFWCILKTKLIKENNTLAVL